MLYVTLKEQDTFVNITHACILKDTLYNICCSSIIVRYAAYEKFSILVKALPKVVLY